MRYEQPFIEMISIDACLLSGSGPDATSIGSPSVRYNSKSIWDKDGSDNTLFNIKEEQSYEDKVYE